MKKIMMAVVGALFAGCCQFCGDEASDVTLVSPDGRNEIRLWTDKLAYAVLRDGVTLVAKTPIGMKVNGACLCESGVFLNATERPVEGKVKMPVYKKSSLSLCGNETYVDFGTFALRLAARNDGVAYRFETKMEGTIRVDCEKAGVTIPCPKAKCSVYRTGRVGCEESVVSFLNADEITTSNEKGSKTAMVYLPLTYKVGDKWVSVTESDVYDYPTWNLVRDEKARAVTLNGLFAKWPTKTEKVRRNIYVRETADYLVETDGTRTFPWRVFATAEKPSDFVANDIVAALARPQVKGGFGWVKPGKVAWDWWNAFDNIGDPQGCTTKTYERFIDFASKKGVEYVIFDEGWSEKLNIWKFHPNVDVPHLIDYAAKRNVGIILWMAWNQVYGDEDHVARAFAKMGAKGFKVDFMDRGDAECERFLWKFAEACRKNKMLLDYHGAHHPTGMSRAYPNVLNYEGIHGLEQMKFFRGQDILANDVACVFTRLVAGSMDYTPGAMDNYPVGHYPTQVGGFNARSEMCRNPGSLGTRARQMAMMALYEAPLQMLCDSPTKYEKNAESFDFMSKVPVVWSDTIGLAGCPRTFVAVARKTRDCKWYAAGLTDSKKRAFTLDTSFLSKGTWHAEIFRDAEDSDEKPMHYVHETKVIKQGDKIVVDMAAGGGFIVRFSK